MRIYYIIKMNTELLNKLLEYTIWKQIDGYENYEVSICGSVRNVKTKRILHPSINLYGYYCVNICKNGNFKQYKVHRLVINAFIPNIEKKRCIDHIDSNRLNNTISNLRWASYQENNRNSSLSSKNTSGVKGVCWNKDKKKRRAQIRLNNKSIHLGYFHTLEQAKIARQNKATELFGEFLNEIEK